MSTFHPHGTLARDGWECVVDGDFTGLRIGAAGRFDIAADDVERMIVPLDARVVAIEHGGGRIELQGRESVFAGPADVAYLGVGTSMSIVADGRFAVAESRADRQLPASVMRAAEVPIEVRGSGVATRRVHNFGTPGALDAQKLIVCEVITPAGSWSSYPPHKHDENLPGHESRLEEIYYFEGRGLFVAETMTETVTSGDVALIPRGYHGPAAAPPEADLYYLNVMAGPDAERVWLITADPTWKAPA